MSVQNKAQNFVSAKVCTTLSSVMLTLTGKQLPKKMKIVAANNLQILSIQDALIQLTLVRFADCSAIFFISK